MQQRVRNLTKRYYDELRKYYYVTPTSYLNLIKTFKQVLEKKRTDIGTIINKFKRGLEQLKNAQIEVAKLEIELTDLGPKLEQAQKDTNILLIDLEKQRKIVAEKSKEVEAEAKECAAKAEVAGGIEADCKSELAKVEPILKRATKAVSELSSSDIDEIRGIKQPSPGVKSVIKTLCMLFAIPPDKKRGDTAKAEIEQRKIVAEKSKEVEAEAKECAAKAEVAGGIEADCKSELAKVEPILKRATKAVSELSSSDIDEIRGINLLKIFFIYFSKLLIKF